MRASVAVDNGVYTGSQEEEFGSQRGCAWLLVEMHGQQSAEMGTGNRFHKKSPVAS